MDRFSLTRKAGRYMYMYLERKDGRRQQHVVTLLEIHPLTSTSNLELPWLD